MPSIFFADPMTSTPFAANTREKNLASVAMDEAPTPDAADVIVARRLPTVLALFHLKKRYYVWTHEPAYAPFGEGSVRDVATDTNVAMSTAFNGDIYLTPLYYFVFEPQNVDSVIAKARAKRDFCAFLATYRTDQSKLVGGVNADLAHFRQNLALHLQAARLCKIYGRGWPEEIAIEGESRGTGWHDSKLGIIESYTYNIAVENTIARNYVTEKHWDPIGAGCVQVYFGAGSGVEAVTPPGAYVDCSGGVEFGEIEARLRGLTQQDREGMLEASVAAYNKVLESWTRRQVIQGMVDRFGQRVRELLDGV